MSYNKRIQLGFIIYGSRGQKFANLLQFEDFKKKLKDFDVAKYDFSLRGDKNRIIADFRAGKLDVVIKNAYGRGNESDVEKFLNKHSVPYFGSSDKATLVGTNKYLSKKAFKKYGLLVPKGILVRPVQWKKNKASVLKAVEKRIGYPCVIKDVAGTDSRGIFLVKNKRLALKVFEKLSILRRDALAEEYIVKSAEVTVLVVDIAGKLKSLIPLQLTGDLFSKAVKDGRRSLGMKFTDSFSRPLINRIKRTAATAHKALGCRMFSRSDIVISGNKPYILEVDVHPGFSDRSATTKILKRENISRNDLFLLFYKMVKKNV